MEDGGVWMGSLAFIHTPPSVAAILTIEKKGPVTMLANPRSTTRSVRAGFTLVELLVVITIIGILIALLLPAVQAAREAARRMQCGNNLKQIALAVHGFAEQNGCFPQGEFGSEVGGVHNTGAMWSAFVIPFLEQQALYDALKISTDDSGDWASLSGTYDPSTPTGKNIAACETVIAVFRCPTASVPLQAKDISVDGYMVAKRIPGMYLGCASGIVTSDVDPSDFFRLDGVFYNHSKTSFADVRDGTSNTLLVCEALPETLEDATTKETRSGTGLKDHWYIGGDDSDTDKGGFHGQDHSEGLGSTGVAINILHNELSFGSAHSGGCQAAFCDGSIHFLTDSIDATVWSRLGNRNDGMPIDGNKF
jgi:prepilin-type N-terminal cleavage/methylation domain-containing protein/prepilin-type processing-associated H-X9-DG protein